MANDGQIVFEVTADGKHAIADIKSITSAIQKETKNWDSAAKQSTDGISNSFDSMFKKIVAGFSAVKVGKALLDVGKNALQAASDLQEVQNVVDTTFGESANTIDKWAKNASKQFGLTETQAKRFTSTIGSMLKSSGMSGDEIVEMSTDLAGLAADMASFYNLDFDTAFQKIRSGISGETEPLKQLGVNMSTANLEAFALAQGLEKTWNQMTQGEQTMLRYQYLMQATADAQGDFAKTSDGYANALRTAQSAVEGIETQLGELLMGPAAQALSWVNDFLGKLTAKPETTVLDDFNQIDIDTQGKLAEIEKVVSQAQACIDKLNVIGASDAGDAVKRIAEGANTLNASAPGIWESVFSSLQDIDGLSNIFGSNSSAKTNIEDLAKVLSSTTIDEGKAEAWKTFLGALSENADAVSNLTGTSVEETKEWLTSLSEAVNSIDAGDAEAWDKLLTTLVKGFSADTPEGKQFIEGLATQFLALGSDSESAVKGLEALGFNTDQISEKQELWLKQCKELVRTIPGLSSIINTETGEIKGGTEAVNEYVKAWEEGQKKLAYMTAHQKKGIALENAFADLPELELNKDVAAYRIKKYFDQVRDIYKKYGLNLAFKENGLLDTSEFNAVTGEDRKALDDFAKAVNDSGLAQAYAEAMDVYTKRKEAYELAKEMYEQEGEFVDTLAGDVENLTDVTQDYFEMAGKTSEEIETLVTTAKDSMTALADYTENVRASVAKSVESVIKGFDRVEKAGNELRQHLSDIAEEEQQTLDKYASEINKQWYNADGTLDLQRMSDNYDNLTDKEKEAYNALAQLHNKQKEVNQSLNEYSASGMQMNLQSQIDFMNEYLDNLEKAKQMGLSNELLAFLADGSTESAEYLAGLVGSGAGAAQEVDRLFNEVNKKKQEFTQTLTDQQLAGDSIYSQLYADAKAAVEALGTLPGAAGQNAAELTQSIAGGINENVPAVKSAVDAIIEQINRLNAFGVNIDLSAPTGSTITMPHNYSFAYQGEFETGLDRVPFDGFLASLHEGEGILTAEENRVWQRFKNGESTTDYDTLGGVMRDNIKPGGNVYLDGKIVGSVISDQQGKSFRQLQRSGWQG